MPLARQKKQGRLLCRMNGRSDGFLSIGDNLIGGAEGFDIGGNLFGNPGRILPARIVFRQIDIVGIGRRHLSQISAPVDRLASGSPE